MTYYETIALLIAILGWPISAYFGHLWTLRAQRIAREFTAKDVADARKRAFLSFMRQWRAEIFAFQDDFMYGGSTIWIDFKAKIPQFEAQLELVRSAVGSKPFDASSKRLVGLEEEYRKHIPDIPRKDFILNAIDDVIRLAA